MRSDTVVIGAGLVGVCAGLHLQRAGHRVTLVERDSPGAGASGHNAGIFSLGNCLPTATPGVLAEIPHMLRDPLSPLAIRWSYLPMLSPWLVRFVLAGRPSRVESTAAALAGLLARATEAYEPFASPGGAAGDPDGALRGGGHLLAYLSDESYARARSGLEVRSRHGIRFEVLDGPELGRLDPLLAGRFKRAVHLPDAPYARDPRGFTAELTRRFLDGSGELRRGEAYDFEIARDRVRAVRTSSGRIPAETVVIAAGAWSRRLVRRLGLSIPLDTERGYGVDLPDPGLPLRIPLISMDYHMAITPARRGWRLAGTDELAGLAAPPRYERAERLVEAARILFPEVGVEGATSWMGHRPSLPDSLPVIGRPAHLANAYLAFGHGHVGLTLAGITGKLIQQIVDGEAPSVDPLPFSPERFALLRRFRAGQITGSRRGHRPPAGAGRSARSAR